MNAIKVVVFNEVAIQEKVGVYRSIEDCCYATNVCYCDKGDYEVFNRGVRFWSSVGEGIRKHNFVIGLVMMRWGSLDIVLVLLCDFFLEGGSLVSLILWCSFSFLENGGE